MFTIELDSGSFGVEFLSKQNEKEGFVSYEDHIKRI